MFAVGLELDGPGAGAGGGGGAWSWCAGLLSRTLMRSLRDVAILQGWPHDRPATTRPTPAVDSVRQRLRDWRTPPTATYSVTPFGLDKKHPNLKACEMCVKGASRGRRVFDHIARSLCVLLIFDCECSPRARLRKAVSNRT